MLNFSEKLYIIYEQGFTFVNSNFLSLKIEMKRNILDRAPLQKNIGTTIIIFEDSRTRAEIILIFKMILELFGVRIQIA